MAISEQQDPYPGWGQLRSESPVFYSEKHDVYFVSRYEDVRRILLDRETFSSRQAFKTPPPLKDIVPRFPVGYPWENTIAVKDPPDHTRMKRLAMQPFTPRAVARMEPTIKGIANDLVDGFVNDGSADIVAEYSQPIPLYVIISMLDAPLEDAPRLRRWTEAFFRLIGSGAQLSGSERNALYGELADMNAYVLDMVEQRRARPGDDLVTALITARSDDDHATLTDSELTAVITSLFTAGTETSASAITQLINQLLTSDGQWSRVQSHPEVIPGAVEEVLRFRGPVKGVQRTVTTDTEVGGTFLPAGSQVYLLLGSTGRDSQIWDQPDLFDPERDASSHLMFGKGLHLCLGIHLARLEVKVAIDVLADRLPDLRVADGEAVSYYSIFRVDTPRHLNVSWDVTE